jgi:serine phosphatase RsbU (regulator of sigma subunit)
MFRSTCFPVHRLSLAEGDGLFLYTDGLTEARNRAGDEYGLGRVQGLAACHHGANARALISECLSDLTGFRESLDQTDDLTLLVVRRTA